MIYKLLGGIILALSIFAFYCSYWLIFTAPDTMVDCKIGQITAVVTYQDCQKLIKYAGSRQQTTRSLGRGTGFLSP